MELFRLANQLLQKSEQHRVGVLHFRRSNGCIATLVEILVLGADLQNSLEYGVQLGDAGRLCGLLDQHCSEGRYPFEQPVVMALS